ncbi:single-stranded DNA-binding protein [Bifidobacterium eulemuris]|uniref:Single-stranded DNA-binding protein n=1 Tax=Bifidobacterium eulemuris TaxID=1765219 RepID=A0A261G9V8_9BIFI|nr:single-stranded DNA-binding protein [Bifidobacterium eulemuris]OZG68217.1 single-stranded DNA-binding protein [Bifidobacterium eulemuris]QOL31726.1 single-stranded DNA-binding protein [Bifidobacterium eulemuris]
MANETILTIIGNLTGDPEVRQAGQSQVANFSIASTPRAFNRQTNSWEDGQALFMRCSAWNDMASHCAQSLRKGMRVIAQGRLQQRSYQANDGSNRTVMELQVDEIGPSLRYATAQVQRQQAGNNGQGYSGGAGFGGNPGFSNNSPFGGAQPAQGQQTLPNTPQDPFSQQAAMAEASRPAASDPWGQQSGGFSTFGGAADFGAPAGSEEPEF